MDLGIADCLARKLNFTAKIAGDREEEDSTFGIGGGSVCRKRRGRNAVASS